VRELLRLFLGLSLSRSTIDSVLALNTELPTACRVSGIFEDRNFSESRTRTKYTYDNLNRLTNLTAVLGSTTITSSTYTYDNAGNRLTKTSPDYSEAYTYDPLNRLTSTNRNGTANQWVYSYDAVGNRLTNQADDVVSSGTYNDSNQLASQTGGGPLRVRGHLDKPGTVNVNGQAAHMLAGNVFDTTITATAGTNTISVVATDVSGNVTSKNYQVTLSGIADTFTNDPNGNVIQKVEGSVTWTYTWDVENRLTQVQNNGSTVATFAYDPLGRRVQKVAGGVTTTWIYDGSAILQQVSGGSTLKYVHGPGVDEPLASDDATALSYFHADGLGSIVKATSTAGAVTLSRQYDAWGNLQLGATTNGFAFTGREWDSETGLYFYRARYLDPKAGRFLSEDPIGFRGGVNFYAYAGNDPVLHADPTGLLQCVKWSDGNMTCVDDPSLCIRMGWCSTWPPKCPTGFVYYGNYGGPGWTGGQCGSWNKSIPRRLCPLLTARTGPTVNTTGATDNALRCRPPGSGFCVEPGATSR
jgi:RHS repeat-associated protein